MLAESLPHDRDQHVKNGDLNEESCQHEATCHEDLGDDDIVVQVHRLEVTKDEVVLVQHGFVKEIVARLVGIEKVVLCRTVVNSIQVANVHKSAKG